MAQQYQYNGKTKFIIVTGGVISGLGKGVAAASIGALLSARMKVVPVKCDGYLNTDPGTMNPTEHGEVFVLDDGGECDMDFGHYERFLNVTAKKDWSLTMGRIFKMILEKERRGDYLGHTVQFIPHVTDLIKEQFYRIADQEKADVLLIEIGGTVGDLENQFYIEAARQLSHDVGRTNAMFVHLTYVPIPSGVNEQKSKPTQMSVHDLNRLGIYPEIVIGRCEEYIKPHLKEKIGLFCNLPADHVISGVDVKHVYECPLVYDAEGVPEILAKRLNIYAPPKLEQWSKLVESLKRNTENPRKTLTVAICGKYMALEDSYASVVEAIRHSSAHLDLRADIRWVDTEKIENGSVSVATALKGVDAVIVPGGFGSRGIEGKIMVIQYVRENKIPFLGICYGMQLSVVEFARNVCGMKGAGTVEMESATYHVEKPVIAYLPGQENIKDMGATMRLGGHDILIKEGSKAQEIYGSAVARERFRHRYEVNPEFVSQIEAGDPSGKIAQKLIFSGKASGEDIMQIMELTDHPYFMACQCHPELKSSLIHPAPLFLGLLKAADERV
ncbi:MAG: CTP synthase (glutamine hydrolyzing) [Fibrobacter sp.]|nr:CTP synthase (glutamine hydrolyzing) [Fibrobacter sp.]